MPTWSNFFLFYVHKLYYSFNWDSWRRFSVFLSAKSKRFDNIQFTIVKSNDWQPTQPPGAVTEPKAVLVLFYICNIRILRSFTVCSIAKSLGLGYIDHLKIGPGFPNGKKRRSVRETGDRTIKTIPPIIPEPGAVSQKRRIGGALREFSVR